MKEARLGGPTKDKQAQIGEVAAQTVLLLLPTGNKGKANKQDVDIANYPLNEDMSRYEGEVEEVLVVPLATTTQTNKTMTKALVVLECLASNPWQRSYRMRGSVLGAGMARGFGEQGRFSTHYGG